MKRLFKWVFRLIVLAMVLPVGLVLFRDPIAKSLVTRQIRNDTGMDVKIAKFSIGLTSPKITIEGFRLINPAEFGGGTFLDVPAFGVRYDLPALLNKKLRLAAVYLNLKEIHVVQNVDGRNNLQALMERQKGKGETGKPAGDAMEFQGIDSLTLAIDRIKFTDLRDPSRRQEIYVGVKNETIKDVKSAKDLQPFVARIVLERSAQFLLDATINSRTNRPPNAAATASRQ